MRPSSAIATIVFSFSSFGCGLPSRDNPNDPAVQPDAAFSITVEGEATTAGGRHAEWALDASASRGDRSWQWFLSDGDAPACEDPSIDWGDAFADTRQVSSSTTALGARLAAIRDFAGGVEPGTGTTERWLKLVVADGDGFRGSACRRITVENRAPDVDLGPARRIAPGGRWWTASRAGSVHDAQPLEIVLEPLVTDEDPGDALLALTAAYPADWRVRGPLAVLLDADGDGRVDPGFFDDPGRRRLRFFAPVTPIRGEIEVRVSDVLDPQAGAPVYSRSASIPIEVRSSHWLFDSGASELVRLDSGAWLSRDLGASARVLATDGRNTLAALTPGVTLALFDHAFREVSPRGATPGVIGYAGAISDGAGGWWVADGTGGTLHHLDASLLETDAFDTVEGDAATEFKGGYLSGYNRMAPAPVADVWILGGGPNTVQPSPRLFRMTPGEGLVVAADVPAPGAHAVAEDGAGGVWVGSAETTEPAVHRFGPESQLLASVPITGIPSTLPEHEVVAMSFDVVRGTLWVGVRSTDASNSTSKWSLLRRDADGSWAGAPLPNVSSIAADPSDGSAVVACAGNGLRRYDASLSFTSAGSISSFSADRVVVTEAGVVASHGFGGTFRTRLLGVEAGADDSGRIIPYDGLPASSGAAATFTVDPLSGMLWLFRPETGAVEAISPEGERLQTLPIPDAAGARGAVAIDPDLRLVRVAWSTSSAGGLVDIALEPNPRAPHGLVPWPDFPLRDVTDLAVVPDGPLCVSARREGAPLEALVVPADGGDPFVVATGAPTSAAADPVTGSCWFVRRGDPTVAWRADSLALLDTVGDGVAGGAPTHTSAAVDHWSGRAYVSAATFQFASYASFLQHASPGGGATAAATPSPTPLASEGWTSEAQSLLIDPFHRSAFVGFSDEVSGPVHPGFVVRYDLVPPATGGAAPELSRWDGFVAPRLGSGW